MLELAICLVIAVTDGDTLKVRCGSEGRYEQITVRLAGIDAPEKKQPYGQRARKELAALCQGVQARIQPRSTDRWRRAVADVQCNGTDVAQYMVGHGWAWVFDKYAQEYKHLYPLQARARAGHYGLWVDQNSKAPPIPPWRWRRNKH